MASEPEQEGQTSCIVVLPSSNLSGQEKTIYRLKIALELMVLLLFVVTMLFVWQLTENRKRSENTNQNGPLPNAEDLLKFKSTPCPVAPSEVSLPPGLPPEVQNSLFHAEDIFRSFEGLAGVVSATGNIVYRDQIVWSRDYGVTDKSASDGRRVDQSTTFRVASVTKLYTALFVYKLLEFGYIDCLDDPLEKYVPDFEVENTFNDEKVTIRQILAHTSGLPREVPCGRSYSYSEKNICPVNTTYVLKWLRNTELKSPPGQVPHYSNLGYALLGRVLAEKFAGGEGEYERWIIQNVFTPLGMMHSGYDIDRVPSNNAIGYHPDGTQVTMVDWDWAAPAFQAYSSVSDLAKLVMALLQESGSTFLKDEHLNQLFKPVYVYPDAKTMFGTGWEMKQVGSYLLAFKSGVIPGYSAGFAVVPELKLGATVLVSGRPVGARLAELMLTKVIEAFQGVQLREQLRLDSSHKPVAYVGVYELQSRWISRVTANITLENGILLFSQTPGYPSISYLNSVKIHEFEVVYATGLSCLTYGLGQNHERLIFAPPDEEGHSLYFTFGAFLFTRVPAASHLQKTDAREMSLSLMT